MASSSVMKQKIEKVKRQPRSYRNIDQAISDKILLKNHPMHNKEPKMPKGYTPNDNIIVIDASY